MTDVFYEQLYKKKKGITMLLAQIGLFVFALLLAVFLFMLLLYVPMGQMIGFLAVVGIGYGAYRLNMFFDIEYEYIYLNGEIDFDKIMAKTSRNRLITVKGKNVELYGVYDESAKAKLQHADIQKVFNFDSGNGNKLYYMTTKDKEFGKTLVIFEPEDRIREDFERYIPKQW
ncbi:MAG: hypothetical protein IJE40_02000 [Clostridia bacterium]|nr:hypothetical protein [Clostridia bacterium]